MTRTLSNYTESRMVEISGKKHRVPTSEKAAEAFFKLSIQCFTNSLSLRRLPFSSILKNDKFNSCFPFYRTSFNSLTYYIESFISI